MPRVGDVFQLLSGTLAVPNTTIQSAPYNAQQQDWVVEANSPRPITAGGTGETTATAARESLGAFGVDDLVGSDTKAAPVDTDSLVIIDSEWAGEAGDEDDTTKYKRLLISDFKAFFDYEALFKAPTTTVHLVTDDDPFDVPDGATHFSIKAVGGGGAGGGGNGTGGGAGKCSAGGGGGAGAYVETPVTVLPGGTTEYFITIGTAGAGVVGDGYGGDGGSTIVTIGANVLTCTGGTGGDGANVSSSVIANLPGQGGAASAAGGMVVVGYGDNGRPGTSGPLSTTSGGGASGPWGRGGHPLRLTSNIATTGNAGSGYGSGGSGAANFESSNNRAGGAGRPGRVEITFYYIPFLPAPEEEP